MWVTWPKVQNIIRTTNWTYVMIRYHPVKFGTYKYWESEVITFFKCHMPHETKWPKGQKIIRHYNWKHAMLRYHSLKFGAYRYCESENIAIFKCHVTKKSKDHKTIGNMPCLGIILTSLVSIGIVKMEI